MDILGLFSRRNMLLGLGGAAAVGAAGVQSTGGAGVFAQLLGPANRGRKGVALSSAGLADWSAQVGSNFTADTGHVLKLVDVQGLPSPGKRPSSLRERGFIARFDVTRGGSLPEALYRVAHPDGGTFEMFLTSGGPDKALRMLANFN